MGELQNIFIKLNIADQMQLNKYINREINSGVLKNNKELHDEAEKKERNLVELNNKTWERIETMLHISMREHHISEDRIDKIDKRMDELDLSLGGKLPIGEETKSEYKVIHNLDFTKIFELLLENKCKDCKCRNDKCEVYPILKKYGIPFSGQRFKCKYAYKRR